MTNAMYLPPSDGAGAYERQLADRCHQAERDRTTLEDELGQARRRSAEQQLRAEQAEAKLAALHEGEAPYEDEAAVPTPAQWIWWWNRATPAERLQLAAQVLNESARLDSVRRIVSFYDSGPALANRLRAALDSPPLHPPLLRPALRPGQLGVYVDGEWVAVKQPFAPDV